jgi:hypothetical protein
VTVSTATRLAKHELTANERSVLEDIFTAARCYSAKCDDAFIALHNALEAKPAPPAHTTDLLGDYTREIENLIAAIAPAAIARVKILAPVDRGDSRIVDLLNRDHQDEAETFLRPIFDEAGIVDDFAPVRAIVGSRRRPRPRD